MVAKLCDLQGGPKFILMRTIRKVAVEDRQELNERLTLVGRLRVGSKQVPRVGFETTTLRSSAGCLRAFKVSLAYLVTRLSYRGTRLGSLLALT
jgi:hypothetical protein